MNIDCNPSMRLGLFRSVCRLARLFLAFGMVLFALSAQAEWGKPAYPVIFIHGINGDAQGTWGAFRAAAIQNKWNFGGSPRWNGSIVTGVTAGHFYTLNFSDSNGLTFFEQGGELGKIISAVLAANPTKTKVILVAHSMGGLAARAYLQDQAYLRGQGGIGRSDDVATLITVGTPHQGSMETPHCYKSTACAANTFTWTDVLARKFSSFFIHPSSKAFKALDPRSEDIKTLTSDVIKLPSQVRYVSIVATWKFQNGTDRNTLTNPDPEEWAEGGDGIVTASSQNLSKIPGFPSALISKHTLVPVTFQDPLWNWNATGLAVTGSSACGTQITWPFVINEVHTCEPQDASVAYYIVQSIIGTSADLGQLPMLQNGPLSYFDNATGQAKAVQVNFVTFNAAPMSVQCRYGSDPSLLDPSLTSTTTVNALSFLQGAQSSSCSIPVVSGVSSQPIYYQAVAQAGTTTAAVISPTDLNSSVGPIHQILVPPAGGLGALLPVPTDLFPASGSTSQPVTPTLTWNTVTGATSYRIMLAQDATALPTDPTDGNCDRCLVDFVPSQPNLTSYAPPAGLLTAGTTYYWQVHARSPDNFGTWTAPSSFTTQSTAPASLLPAPTQTAPADGDSGQTTMPTLRWRPITGATSYRIMIAPSAAALTTDPTSADCPACLTNAVVPGAQGTSYVPYVGLLAVGSTYYWSVKARSPDSYGAWSAVRSFTPAAQAQIVTEFSVGISAGAYPLGITAGPDGNLWFTEYADRGNRIGRITPAGMVTEFSIPSSLAEPIGITAGPDGNLWFIESSYNGWNPKIGRINSATGVVTEFSGFRGLSSSIAAGPDGNLWFGQFDSIASITPQGVVRDFSLLHSFSPANCITAGPDGNLWSTVGGVEVSAGTIYRITTAGVLTEIGTGIPSGGGFPCITAGPDGNLWFTGYNANVIGRITPTGVVTQFSAGISAGANPYSITAGPDGNLWFTEPSINRIGRITPAGVVTEFSLPALAGPVGITAGPDGNIWFTEPGANRIGRITLGGGSGSASIPGAPTAASATAGNAQATVSFTAPGSDGGTAITSYTASCSASGQTTQSASGAVSPLAVAGLTNGVAYTCTVTATNAAGTGAASSSSNSVSPKGNQTIGAITFSPISLSVGGTTTASATATSGLAVSLTSTTLSVCTVSGSTVAGVSAGTCTVAADQAGDASYMAALQVTQNLAVTGAVPMVSLSPTSLLFAAQNVGTSSTAQTVALTNTGGATLNFTSITASGDFAVTNNCGGGLGAGGTCDLSVTFTPTVAGVRTGAITITSNAAGSPHTLALSGGLVAPVATSLDLAQGWNLLGNGTDQPLTVATLFGDSTLVTTVWKWDVTKAGWQFYAPSMDAPTLQNYATGKSYGVLSVVNPGEGFWVNASQAFTKTLPSGTAISVIAFQAGQPYALKPGWNLVAIGNTLTPNAFNVGLSVVPPSAGVVPINLTTLWAWDNPLSKWYFYAPNLEALGGSALTNYIISKGYLDFTANNKTLGPGVGFWVNKP